MAEDVLESKTAIKAMLGDDQWSEIVVNSTSTALDGTDRMDQERWWAQLRLVVQLGKPIAEAITQIQGDMPKLSAVLPMWDDLIQHAKTWASSVQESPATAALATGQCSASSLLRTGSQHAMSRLSAVFYLSAKQIYLHVIETLFI